MSRTTYTQRIPEWKWKEHKDTIYRLYVTEKKPLTAEGGVKDIMSNAYGFFATKAQYETRLKNWGFHKYKSGHNRRSESHVPGNHRAEVRETDRRSSSPDNDAFNGIHPLSRHFPIRTLPPHFPTLQPALSRRLSPLVSSSTLDGGWQDDLSSSVPGATFYPSTLRGDVDSAFSRGCEWSSNAFPSTANDPIDSGWQTFINDDTTRAAWNHLEVPTNFGSLTLPPHKMDAGNLIAWNDLGSSSSHNLLAAFSPNATTFSGDFSIPGFAMSMMPVILRMFPNARSSVPMTLSRDSATFESTFKNMSHPSTLQHVRQQKFHHQIIYMVFHRLLNDSDAVRALDMPETHHDYFLKAAITYCFSYGEKALSTIFDSPPSPYTRALVQNLFCAALITGHGQILNVLLAMDQGILVNRLVFAGNDQYYPLEYASIRGHVEAVKVLLDHGGDPNRQNGKPFLPRLGLFKEGIAQRVRDLEAQTSTERFQIVQLLLGRGLELNPKEVALRMEICGKDEFLLLANKCLSTSSQIFIYERALPDILLRLDWDDSLSAMLEDILDQAHPHGIAERNIWDSVLSQSLSSAVLRSHTSVVDILLNRGAEPDVDCLISAVQNDDWENVERFLDHGLDPNIPKSDENCTALSESIKKPPPRRAFELLEARGFMSQLADRPTGYAFALVAACQVDDIILVQRLLSLRKLPKERSSIHEALEAAVRGNRLQIIKQLLSAGIKPSAGCIELAIRNKQLEVFKLLINYFDLSVMLSRERHHSIIFEALRWGDHAVIEHVLLIEHPVNVLRTLSPKEFEDWSLGLLLEFPWLREGCNVTPLSTAILKSDSRAVRALIAHGAQVMVPNAFNAHLTFQQYSTPSDLFGTAGTGFNWTVTPLAAGAITHNIPLVKEFLRIGADPFDNIALLVCAVSGFEDIAMLLLSAFRDRYPDGAQSFGSDALFHIVRANNARLLELLAEDTDIIGHVYVGTNGEHGTYISAYLNQVIGFTSPLGEAIRLHSVRGGAGGALDVLLPWVKDRDAVIHKDHERGNMTTLLYAIALKSLDTVKKLVLAGANTSLPAVWSIPRTPLQAAAEAGSKEILEYLLGKGVSPNEPPATRAGATALQLAAISGNIRIATILLNHGAEINAQPALIDGRTAFEGATEHGRIEMMIFLFQHGADLLSNRQEQHRRAVEFAEDNAQHAAKSLADELLEKALSNQPDAFFSGMEGIGWPGNDMGGFGNSSH